MGPGEMGKGEMARSFCAGLRREGTSGKVEMGMGSNWHLPSTVTSWLVIREELLSASQCEQFVQWQSKQW